MAAGDARALQPPWVMVGAAALIALGLHPAGREFGRSVRLSRTHPALLVATAIATVPLIAFAATNVGRQATVADDHAAAGLLPILLAVSSSAYPDATSSLSRPWLVAATVWGLAFVVAAQLSRAQTVSARTGLMAQTPDGPGPPESPGPWRD